MPASAPDIDTELAAEQAHLAQSRAQLARMRERTASMDSAAAGDWVSREYLESTFALRMKQLADDPTIPLFFGRVDYSDGEDFHIGRRHISDPTGEPMVIDWRAPVSLPFYRASRTEPMGVGLRRRYGFQQGRLTAYEDEDLAAGEVEEHSAILEAEIERPRVGPMRDIVATIQPEQDVIVRSDLSRTICVQGAPGTGKTAVGLHRAAYLLYAHREQLTRQGVLVVGPNASFLRYIRDVLPALGEIDASQTTIEELVAKTLTGPQPKSAIRGQDPADVATLKSDARMAAVLERALWAHLITPTEGLVVPRGARRWRVAAYEAEELVESLRSRGVRYGAARAMLPQSLAHRILVKMELAGDSPDDRVQDAVARSKPVKDYAKELWPAVDPARLLWRLLAEPVFLAAAADGILEPEEQAALLWTKPPRSPGATRWSLPDAVLLDEAADLVERTPSLAHIVVDEAQDLSPMMLRAPGPSVLDRLAHRARRPGPGHHALGDPDLGRGAHAPRQAGRPRRGADPRLPGARRRDRVRRAAAAGDRARADPADLGATSARRPVPRHRARGSRRRGADPSAGPDSPGGLDRTDRAGRPDPRPGPGADRCRDRARAARRRGDGRDRVRAAPRPGAGIACEGARVRPRRPGRAGRDRGRRAGPGDRAEAALRLPDSRGHVPGRPAQIATSGGARCLNGAVDLGDRWPLAGCDGLRDELVSAYAAPTRGYHDTRHLTEVLDRLDELSAAGVAYDEVTVRLAAWFHDCVYDGQPWAEERSAVWAERALPGAGLEADAVAEVARLVRLTETHRPADRDVAGCVLSDADLAILAAPEDRYAEFVAAVRREYSHVPDAAFREGRADILRDLLAKPHLFHTAYAREHWEEAARANVHRELSR